MNLMYMKALHISIVYTNMKYKIIIIIIIAMPHFIADLRDGPKLNNSFMTLHADEMVQLNWKSSQSLILFATTKQ